MTNKHPDLPSGHASAVQRACVLLREGQTIDYVSRKVGMSRYHFQRVFKETLGCTPGAYVKSCRADKLRERLSESDSVTDAIYASGYGASSRFYEEANEILGMAANRYRKGGEGEVIRFAVGECSLGAVLVASSEKGICALFLGDDPQELVNDLEKRFGKAVLLGGEKDYEEIVAKVVGFIESPSQKFDLPLDLRGSVFQMKVWKALAGIKHGETVSYAELAQRVGMPKATRAVASACGANPVSVVIPCHRVVRADGSLSGYRWGVERKKRLLDRERR
ncbi:DNA-O6-methylguanine--protein-cysteine S-methyltransferase /Transcriptional regulator Ada [Rubritalea squalenifaciens DSM 18772]|uniref:methylated-DNA--[protein]-cysteine S-methyltransferase n=1 Tax=Rubritalea squalenifaciens DSM 18772 TaxID=1123071 RepID=A0A1M6I1S4_9BACT|nr:methylated-DNA--[protein]-cysteine S-methyltransferase [Rubritalea squalenifaciens]SHJ28391.1 DNA-O6-methylguanine--protein-cysteine S-methyltransferase /Transcriptional regulator Ada [Rubritalea squalenifaciens DSM 18772]